MIWLALEKQPKIKPHKSITIDFLFVKLGSIILKWDVKLKPFKNVRVKIRNLENCEPPKPNNVAKNEFQQN